MIFHRGEVKDREGPYSEAELPPAAHGAADCDLDCEQLDDWLGERALQSELNMSRPTRPGTLATRHSLQRGERTCAPPLGLSGIGIDTLGCTEVE